MEGNPYQDPNQPYGVQPVQQPLPPAAQSIKDLVKMAGLIALIFAILGLVFAIFTLGVTLILVIVDFLVWYFCKEIDSLMDQRRFEEAKSKTLIWMILGLLLGGIVPGIILLIAYLKFSELNAAPAAMQAPPPPPPA